MYRMISLQDTSNTNTPHRLTVHFTLFRWHTQMRCIKCWLAVLCILWQTNTITIGKYLRHLSLVHRLGECVCVRVYYGSGTTRIN